MKNLWLVKKIFFPPSFPNFSHSTCRDGLLLFSHQVVSDSLWPQGPHSMPGFPVLHCLLELAQLWGIVEREWKSLWGFTVFIANTILALKITTWILPWLVSEEKHWKYKQMYVNSLFFKTESAYCHLFLERNLVLGLCFLNLDLKDNFKLLVTLS